MDGGEISYISVMVMFNYFSKCVGVLCNSWMKLKYVCHSNRAKEDSNYPADSTIAARAFITRNYTISTSTAQVANVISDGSVVSVSSYVMLVLIFWHLW